MICQPIENKKKITQKIEMQSLKISISKTKHH